MNRYPSRIRRALLGRSFLVQGSWNYETLIGSGFAFVLLPALRFLFDGDRRALDSALQRHSELFNAHPYLATVAIGAVARLEAEGTDPATIQRFKNALRGSLGALGDQVVWQAWRPATALLGLGLWLAGAPWWVSVGVFLLVYNALHLWLRARGLQIGLDAGLQVGAALRELPLRRWAKWAADGGALLIGFCVVLVASSGGRDAAAVVVTLAGALGGAWLGSATRRAMWWMLAGALVLGVIISLLMPLR